MIDKGLKQKYVAEKAGFTQQEFSNMMNGRKLIMTDYIVDICLALGVQPNDVFNWDREEKKQ